MKYPNDIQTEISYHVFNGQERRELLRIDNLSDLELVWFALSRAGIVCVTLTDKNGAQELVIEGGLPLTEYTDEDGNWLKDPVVGVFDSNGKRLR